jgi:membrane fusion protein, heavy metal efflux system
MKTTKLTRIGTAFASLIATAVLLSACSKQAETSGQQTQTVQPAAKVASSGDVCVAHDAPKELCFICDASLREKGRLWCKEHSRYEDRCWLCHPELEDKNRLYCKEHSLYEDECFLCHPELLEKEAAPADGKTSASTEGRPAAAALMCKEHGVPELECGICHPDLLNQKQPGQGLKLRLPSPDSAAMAGVVVGTPGVDTMSQSIESFAEVMFDQNKLAQITPLVGGIVKSVEVDLGSRVKAGDLLARVTSVAIGEAQSAYVRALAEDQFRERTLERERNLRAQRISSEKDLQEAEAAHQAGMAALLQAKQQLMVLGFEEEQIQALAEQKGKPGVLEIRAPFAGEIVERTAVQGALAEMGRPLFTLADTTALWAMVSIPESQLSKVKVGQKVELTVESLPGRTFTGILTWLSAKVDDRTRMARGRVEVSNADGRLKAQMFARARILTSASERAVTVPQSALQNVSGMTVVFVKSSSDLFEARPVQLGAKRNGHIGISAGLKPDEPIVIAGSFALKSQFLISRLGAGCVD